MKFVTGENENIRVIELPDDARPITLEDEAVLAARAADEQERINIYKASIASAQQKHAIQVRIGELKRLLNKTDYQAIKFAEGEMPEEEYAPIKAERATWRAEINELEGQAQEVSYGR